MITIHFKVSLVVGMGGQCIINIGETNATTKYPTAIIQSQIMGGHHKSIALWLEQVGLGELAVYPDHYLITGVAEHNNDASTHYKDITCSPLNYESGWISTDVAKPIEEGYYDCWIEHYRPRQIEGRGKYKRKDVLFAQGKFGTDNLMGYYVVRYWHPKITHNKDDQAELINIADIKTRPTQWHNASRILPTENGHYECILYADIPKQGERKAYKGRYISMIIFHNGQFWAPEGQVVESWSRRVEMMPEGVTPPTWQETIKNKGKSSDGGSA